MKFIKIIGAKVRVVAGIERLNQIEVKSYFFYNFAQKNTRYASQNLFYPVDDDNHNGT